MEKIKRKLSIVSVCILIFVFLFPSFQQVFADGEEREVVAKVLHINNINNNKALEQIETLVGLNCNYGETAYIGEYFSVYNLSLRWNFNYISMQYYRFCTTGRI